MSQAGFDFWTPQRIADDLGVSSQYIVQIIQGKSVGYNLSATKVSGRWLIQPSDAQDFIAKYKREQSGFYSPQDIAKAIGKSRAYVLDALTGYGGRKEPRLVGEKRGDRWVIGKEEGDRFIGEHGKGEG
jgi:biotin operon repressor